MKKSFLREQEGREVVAVFLEQILLVGRAGAVEVHVALGRS